MPCASPDLKQAGVAADPGNYPGVGSAPGGEVGRKEVSGGFLVCD